MPDFLALDGADRALAFEQAALRRQCSPVMVEKDFWVSWLLRELFAESQGSLVFKGGTSLSKVFGVIDRFSEDIDLCLTPALVGADEHLFDGLESRTRRDAAMNALQDLCKQYTREMLAPHLEGRIRQALGEPEEGRWLRFEEDPSVLLFRYPSVQPAGFEYLPRSVKLEPGSLTDQQPVGLHAVRPWVADDFPAAFEGWRCEVTALELGRTFWEKATILHAEYHRPAGQPTPDRYSRHYSDMARLLQHRDSAGLLANEALARRVVEWKDRLFGRAWARYDLARRGSFRLVPPASRIPALRDDYLTMRPMFLAEPPSFDEVLAQLAQAERELNAA